jgi:hypothetical protein
LSRGFGLVTGEVDSGKSTAHGPRRVNDVATACLLAGFVERKSLIDEATATKALAEFQDDLGG